jgi:hypothetical protein
MTFGTLGIAAGGTNSTTALNNNRIMVSSGGAIVEAGALANGQLLIGSTGAAPVAAAITAGAGISVTNGAGTITIASAAGGSGKEAFSVVSSISSGTQSGFIGEMNGNSSEDMTGSPMPFACTPKTLYVKLTDPVTGTGATAVFGLRKNYAAPASQLTCTISTGSTTCNAAGTGTAYVAGDLWDISYTSNSTVGLNKANIAFECDY